MNAQPLDTNLLYGLAPQQLPNYRNLRYDGDGVCVELSQFDQAQQQVLHTAYEALQRLFVMLGGYRDQPDEVLSQIRQTAERDAWGRLVAELRQIRLAQGASVRQAQVLHDVRGGGFLALSLYLHLAELGSLTSNDLHRMFCLTRDQLKIMRNAIKGIDPEGLARDMHTQLHGIDLLIDKWGRGEGHQLEGAASNVRVISKYDGNISERCLEFSALDRVIYNLMNNATHHSADGVVDFAILPLSDDPIDLRFVIYNRVQSEQAMRLQQNFPEGLGQLFNGGFTTGGNGIGMRICADFVTNAYGLGGVEQGLDEGHLGATLIEDRFVTWFHWPIVAD